MFLLAEYLVGFNYHHLDDLQSIRSVVVGEISLGVQNCRNKGQNYLLDSHYSLDSIRSVVVGQMSLGVQNCRNEGQNYLLHSHYLSIYLDFWSYVYKSLPHARGDTWGEIHCCGGVTN